MRTKFASIVIFLLAYNAYSQDNTDAPVSGLSSLNEGRSTDSRLSDLIHTVLNLPAVIKLSKSELVQRKYGKVFLFFEENALKPEDSIIYQNGVPLEVNNAREPSDKPHYVFKRIDIQENTAYVLVELDVTGFVCFGNLDYVDGKWIPDREFRVGYR